MNDQHHCADCTNPNWFSHARGKHTNDATDRKPCDCGRCLNEKCSCHSTTYDIEEIEEFVKRFGNEHPTPEMTYLLRRCVQAAFEAGAQKERENLLTKMDNARLGRNNCKMHVYCFNCEIKVFERIRALLSTPTQQKEDE